MTEATTKAVADAIGGVAGGANDAAAVIGGGGGGAVTGVPPGDPADFIDLNMPTTIVGTMIIEELVTLTVENATQAEIPDDDIGGKESSHSPGVTAFVAAALSLIIILTVGGNILVVLSPIVSKRLRTVTYTFLVSLAIADLLLGITVLPWSAIYTISSEWPFSVVFCNIYISCDVMFCTSSILHLLVISLERYFAITKPYAYQRKMNHRKATTIIVVVWVVSLGVSFLPLHLGWNTADGSVQNYNHPTQCILTWNMAYALFDGILLFFLPLILMLFVYARIVTIAYHQAKAIQSVMVKPAPSIRSPVGGNNSTSAQEKQENTNNNHKNVVDEHKAVKIIAVVMGSFVVCWVPYFTMFTFGPLCNWNISDLFYNIVLWLGYINSLINPLVYALMNREFRRAFKTILSCARWNTKCIGSFGSRDHDSQIKYPATNTANSRYNGSTMSYSTRDTYASTCSKASQGSRKSSGESLTFPKLQKAAVDDIAEVSEPSLSDEQQHGVTAPENHALLAESCQEQEKVSPAESMELQDIKDDQYQEQFPPEQQEVESEDPQPNSQQLLERQPYVDTYNNYNAPLSQIAEVSELEESEQEQEQDSASSSPHESTGLLQEHAEHEPAAAQPELLIVEDVQPPQSALEQHESEKDSPPSPAHETTVLLQEEGDESPPPKEVVTTPSSDSNNCIDELINEEQHLLQNGDNEEHDTLKRPLSSSLSSDKEIAMAPDGHNPGDNINNPNNEIITVECS